MGELYIGLLSGTSVDAIDAALVDFAGGSCRLRTGHSHPIPAPLCRAIHEAIAAPNLSITNLAELDTALGDLFAEAALELLGSAGIDAREVTAIGSHGVTLRHLPDAERPTSLQLGDPNRIAEFTGVATVADFRRRDMAAGGEGAPLAPAFHRAVLTSPGHARGVLNIGGIANLTVLPAAPEGAVLGFDTGPGNTLMDAWTRRHLGETFDRDGRWAAGGTIEPTLLERLLEDPYFERPPPKSTGRERFNEEWLSGALEVTPDIAPADAQATLCELTASSAAAAVRRWGAGLDELLVCGGGVHNAQLMARLAAHLPGVHVGSTADAGVDPDWMEAMAFAWLARQCLLGRASNLPSVSGARRPVVLGAIYPARAT